MSGRLQQLIAHYTVDPRAWFRNWRWRPISRVSNVRDKLGADESMFFAEKTLHHILALPFILRAFTNAHIVHVTRDGRDCLRSAWSNNKVPRQ